MESHSLSAGLLQKRINYFIQLSHLSNQQTDTSTLIQQFCTLTHQLLETRAVRFIQNSTPPYITYTEGLDKTLPITHHPLKNEDVFINAKIIHKEDVPHPFTWVYLLPLVFNQKMSGYIEFYSDQLKPPTSSLLLVIESGARQFCAILEKNESELELKKNMIEIRETQSALIQSEKLASIGTIAAGVAHEINNPLSFLLSNLETLSLYHQKTKQVLDIYQTLESGCRTDKTIKIQFGEILSKLTQVKKSLEHDYILTDQNLLVRESLEGIYRISEIVKSLKTFARVDHDDSQEINVNECILAALRVASNELKYKCEVVKNLQQLPLITMNPSHLLQVIMNIIINAAQAMDKRGRITINSYLESKNICISITDTGTGMSPETQNKLFTPFFTTKPVGKGTGLGLSVSYGIIKKLGGTILVESTLGKGTTFIVQIPIQSKNNKADEII